MAKRGSDRRQVLGALGAIAILAGRPASGTVQSYPRLRRGINFHHLLNWPEVYEQDGRIKYVWAPFNDVGHKLRQDDLNRVKALGFDFIRVTVDPSILIVEGVAHWRELEMHYLQIVGQMLAAGFQVVFDLAPVAVNPAFAPDRLTAPESAALFDGYATMVRRVAGSLSRLPPDRIALELFNEPPLTAAAEETRWRAMQARLHREARSAAPDLPLVLTGALWGDRTTLMRLDLAPYRGSNVLFTFHYYDPHVYTHQGVSHDDTAYVAGLEWPIRNEQAEAIFAQTLRVIMRDPGLDAGRKASLLETARHVFSRLTSEVHDEQRVASDFAEVRAWGDRNGVAPDRILLGEFGCVLSSHGVLTGASRLAWLSAVRRAAESQAFAWAYWAYKGYGGMELVDSNDGLHADLVAPLGLTLQTPRTPRSLD